MRKAGSQGASTEGVGRQAVGGRRWGNRKEAGSRGKVVGEVV